jgi:hypothetical protein
MDGPLELIRGVYKFPDRLLHVLDTRALVDQAIRLRDENFSR